MRNKGQYLICLGLLLIAAALSLAVYNLLDGMRAGRAAQNVTDILNEVLIDEIENGIDPNHELVIPDYLINPDMEMPVKTIDGIDYIGILRIPTLQRELPVASQWSYPNLKTAPCRYSGSAYLDNLVICGHNYSSHFGTLKNLRIGDTVILEDMDGNTFRYHMTECEVLAPTAIEEMEEEMQTDKWDLTLFTCSVGGQTRLTLRFEKE